MLYVKFMGFQKFWGWIKSYCPIYGWSILDEVIEHILDEVKMKF
jgi:hypothetical protein